MVRIIGMLMLWLISSVLCLSAYGATPAGTRILNQAVVTFADENGNTYDAMSNEAVFVVADAPAHQLIQDNNILAVPKQTVYLPHILTNVGNIADAYNLTLKNITGDNGDLDNLKIYWDANGDGQLGKDEIAITETPTLKPDQAIHLLVSGTLSATAQLRDQFKLEIESQSKLNANHKRINLDTITVADKAIVSLTHSSDTACSTPLKMDEKFIQKITYLNNGNIMPTERLVTVDGSPMSGILLEQTLSDYVSLASDSTFDRNPDNVLRVVYLEQLGWVSLEKWDKKQKVKKVGILAPATNFAPTKGGRYSYYLQVVKVPTEDTIIDTQVGVDENGDGKLDAASNASCNTVAVPEDPTADLGDIEGKVFDSKSLEVVSGATIELYKVAPASIAKVTRTAADEWIAKSDSDNVGSYSFKGIKAGTYYLKITSPASYTNPSVIAPETFASTVYKNVAQPSYGFSGYTPVGEVASGNEGIFILAAKTAALYDIPVDRKTVEGKVSIEKVASKQSVAIGDFVVYTVKIQNLTSEPFDVGTVEDVLPYGFKYVSGTAKINDAYIANPTMQAGDDNKGTKLTFSLGKLDEKATFTLTYVTQVTAMATTSNGINTAVATLTNNSSKLTTQSATVRAQVAIKQEGVLSDKAILFGRLATTENCNIGEDKARNKTGWPLANVRIYMEDGTYVMTDPNGQYSIYGLKPGLHVLKVDNHSLPEGTVLIANDTAHAGDPDSRFVDLLPADMQRADFTAQCPQKAADKREPLCVEQKLDSTGKEWVTRTINNVLPPLRFESGKSEIKPEYIEKLRNLYELAKDKHNVRLGFTGHTDNQALKAENKAKYKDNVGLSKQRAYEAAALVLQAMDQELEIGIDGKGELEPVASNATADGMAQNRRVEVSLIYDEPVDIHSQTVRRECTTKLTTGLNVVGDRLVARAKASAMGWHAETELLDPNNLNSLNNLSNQAGAAQDGDISNGLLAAYKNQVKEANAAISSDATQEEAEKEITMPVAKEIVKDITSEQAKAGAWLWPLADTSLDGRFMVVTPEGTTPKLYVNGKAVTDSQLGEQILNKKAGAQVMAWYGVELNEGENQVKVVAKDGFGNERVLANKTFKRPSAAIGIKMSVDGNLIADGGRSSVPVKIQVLDKNGYPAKGVYFLTVESAEGEWVEADIQDKVPGHQVKITNGERVVHLRSTQKTGQVKVRASTGVLQSETDVNQIAEMRPLIAVGMVDLRAFHNYGDGYESVVLQQVDDNSNVDGRAALFMKGRIKGDKHLTLAYDSKKDPDTELLRDIDPEAYYQVYGDSAMRGYEAQSRSKLYVKVEKDRHSIMWGDYTTDSNMMSADIARVQRTLTGANGIYDDGTTRVQVFASRPDNPRDSREISGNGTALHFSVGNSLVRNSEIIEVITRDKANSGLILKVEKLERFRDYSIDEVTGNITFHNVVPTLDSEGNPVSVRVSYDKDVATSAYTVAGIRAQTKVTNEVTVGASYTKDEHPTDGSEVTGIYSQYKDADTTAEIGAARMEHANGDESGQAVRAQLTKKWNANSHTDFIATQADAGYTNSSSGVQADRRELKLTHEQRVTKDITTKAELVNSESLSTDAKRQSAELSATATVDKWKLKGGMRNIKQSDATNTENINTVIVGAERGVEVMGKKGNIKAEHEREIGGDRKRTMLGAEVDLGHKTKGYMRYEQADQLAGGTLAGTVDTSKNLVAGVRTDVLPSTQMYNEYRIEGDINGQDVVAVSGVKSNFDLEKNLVLSPSIEFMNYLESTGKSDSVAASVAITDTRDKASKKLMRVETRRSDTEHYYGLNGTYVTKVNDNVTAMVGDQIRYTNDKTGGKDSVTNTLTVAAAHRPQDGGPYNALYAYKWKKDTQVDEDTHVLSTHQHYRVDNKTDISGHIGAKHGKITTDNKAYSANSAMVAGHLQKDVNDKVGVDVHGGVMLSGGNERYIAGAGAYYNVMKNVRVGAGYNVSGVQDKDLDPNGTYQQGAYVGLQLKVDEDMFKWLEK